MKINLNVTAEELAKTWFYHNGIARQWLADIALPLIQSRATVEPATDEEIKEAWREYFRAVTQPYLVDAEKVFLDAVRPLTQARSGLEIDWSKAKDCHVGVVAWFTDLNGGSYNDKTLAVYIPRPTKTVPLSLDEMREALIAAGLPTTKEVVK